MMVIENVFTIGQTVYLKTDKDQHPRIVTGISIKQGALLYELSSVTAASWHYDFEIDEKINILLATTN